MRRPLFRKRAPQDKVVLFLLPGHSRNVGLACLQVDHGGGIQLQLDLTDLTGHTVHHNGLLHDHTGQRQVDDLAVGVLTRMITATVVPLFGRAAMGTLTVILSMPVL